MSHKPVLLNEVLNYLNIEKNKKYIDCTLGDGGHTLEILKKGGIVLGIDYSQDSINRAVKKVKEANLEQNFISVCANFKDIYQIAQKHNFLNVDGILFDLGYSSTQLEQDNLGISFNSNTPLDMRIDKSLGVTAADLVNTLSQKQLEILIRAYGEERLARRFAKRIVEFRELKPFYTTKDLADLLVDEATLGYENGRIHPATRTFQALRIVVNDELENLKKALPQAARNLQLPDGRMVIISFHSLEDKLVKDFGQSARLTMKALNKKPITPTASELSENKRARSAKMRVYEKYA